MYNQNKLCQKALYDYYIFATLLKILNQSYEKDIINPNNRTVYFHFSCPGF